MKRDWFLCVMQLIQKLRVVCLAVHNAVDIDRLFAVNDLVDAHIVAANNLPEFPFRRSLSSIEAVQERKCV